MNGLVRGRHPANILDQNAEGLALSPIQRAEIIQRTGDIRRFSTQAARLMRKLGNDGFGD
jgi:hypothetical protein